jgi:hypothetical protein
LNFTLVAPVKFVPVIDTLLPTAPLDGEKLEIVGAGTPPPVNLRPRVVETRVALRQPSRQLFSSC